MAKVEDLFEIKYGINMELNKLTICEEHDTDTVNFVSRTDKNNGVSAIVKKVPGKIPQPAGVLTVAGGGSVLATFIQDQPFYSGRDIFILTPQKPMSFLEKMFYAECIKSNRYRYNYGRQANKTLPEISLPEQIPDWVANVNIPEYTDINADGELVLNQEVVKNSSLLSRNQLYPITDGGDFDLETLFQFERGKCGNAGALLEDGEDIAYIGAKKSNNGVMKMVKQNNSLVTKGNCIVFISDGQGSVGYSLYQPDDFIGSTTLTIGRNPNLNKYTGLFLVTLLDLERTKYSYGRKYSLEKIKQTFIKLPITNEGEPDWDYMERYIKGLPFSKYINQGA